MELQKFIETNGTLIQIEKGEQVFAQGELCDYVYLVKTGLLKAFYLTENGKETIKSFVQSGTIIGSLNAAHCHVPSTFSLQAIEACKLIQVPFKALLTLSKESISISQELIQILLSLSLKKERREFELLTLSATQRYENLCSAEPELVKNLTQNDIAKYLGITPVALSRIKNK
ncbi:MULTISPECIES: Crp/Fnr family transcriptional regulator [Pseudoalteromonas]|uniref:Crp/Fnr family transcriptional regulator n=1 Tax=Pseudoalteromonas obscura TaxID=3048491 RepID=A0ABT7EFX5_9GAMM|nr:MULTISPECIES: Crp/Fnr family transcriptional regulator [Pseudoalteromonas]MBQ4838554.1 Crp/Fnr family transcriptional regulator [Pseudoalteromonas luteoviolacea]MDK2593599.1 Crp/Fnr family transcriptional regulator [Pseudoalteromonas sp. P94(2023)]